MKGERFFSFFRRGRRGPDNEVSLSETDFQVLSAGRQLHLDGILWWHALQINDKLLENGLFLEKKVGDYLNSLATLQRRGQINAIWSTIQDASDFTTRPQFQLKPPDTPMRLFQVSQNGLRAHNPMFIENTPRDLPRMFPIPEPGT